MLVNLMQPGEKSNLDFTGRDLFYLETKFQGEWNLNEIVNHENTRYDNGLRTWKLGDEPGMFHCADYERRNYGTDWIIYMTYHDDPNSQDFYWQFSVIPPRPTDVWLMIRGLRESLHSQIVAYEMNLSEEMFRSRYPHLESKSLFLSPLPSYCQRLTDFMEQCRSWHGSPDTRIV